MTDRQNRTRQRPYHTDGGTRPRPNGALNEKRVPILPLSDGFGRPFDQVLDGVKSATHQYLHFLTSALPDFANQLSVES
jgi:hypothetical protein